MVISRNILSSIVRVDASYMLCASGLSLSGREFRPVATSNERGCKSGRLLLTVHNYLNKVGNSDTMNTIFCP